MQTAVSPDGTPIAFDQGGSGPHLVLVHGAIGNRKRWAAIRPKFEEYFTVTAMDRRGRGDSGDGPEYSIEREFEDVIAVVEALEGPILLFGHSYGAICALEAATRTRQLSGLILYEPPIREGEGVCTPEQLERLEALLAAGDREGVLKEFLREVVGMPPHELDLLTSSPVWPSRVAAAHTLPRELRAEESYSMDAQRIRKLATPVLLLLGGDSPKKFSQSIAKLQQVLPNSRTVVMPGQQHVAMDTAPDLVTDAILEFWHEINGVDKRLSR